MANPSEQEAAAEPHNLQAEESLLGAMLLSRDAIGTAVGIVNGADFYRPLHGAMFDAISGLWLDGDPVDAVTVDYELRNVGLGDSAGGIAALLTLISATPATSNAAGYARIVADLAALRRLIGAAGEIAGDARSGPEDVAGLVADAVAKVEGVMRDGGPRRRGGLVADALGGWLDGLEARSAGTSPQVGEPTGWRDVDRLLVGLRAGQLVIVGGRASVGKSQTLVGLAVNMATRGVPVAFLSLEMTVDELHDRIVAIVGRVDREEIRRGVLRETSWMRLSSAVGKLADMPLWVFHDQSAGVSSARTVARMVERLAGRPPVLLVDYVQLMVPAHRGENRQVEVAEISRSLKRAAGELGCPVVAGSQLRRQVDERGDKHPLLADLRETGSLENDADVVVLIFRPDAYDASVRPGEVDLIVAKQRNGPVGTATLLHDAKTGRLYDRPEEDLTEPLAFGGV